MRAIARAKINLMLRVTGLRDDGYHEIESVAQALELHDALDFTPSSATSVRFTGIPIDVDGPDLIARAIDEYNRTSGSEAAFQVAVNKAIPPRAGLGGGSADAAAALLVCDEMADRPIGAPGLMALAGSVGADVAFCIQGGTAAMRGTGASIAPMHSPSLSWVLCIPAGGLSTDEVYGRSDEMASRSDPMTRSQWDAWASALGSADVEAIAGMLHNDLAAPACEMMPDLGAILEAMRAAGALGSVMTGSGSAVCGLCLDPDHAERVAAALDPGLGEVIVTRSSVNGAEIVRG